MPSPSPVQFKPNSSICFPDVCTILSLFEAYDSYLPCFFAMFVFCCSCSVYRCLPKERMQGKMYLEQLESGRAMTTWVSIATPQSLPCLRQESDTRDLDFAHCKSSVVDKMKGFTHFSLRQARKKLLTLGLGFIPHPAVGREVTRVDGRRIIQVPVLENGALLPGFLVSIQLAATTTARNHLGQT